MAGGARIEELRGRAPEFVLIAFVLLTGAAAGAIGVRDARLGAVAVAAVVLLLLVSRRPVTLAVVALGGVYAVQRLGSTSYAPGTAGGISYSDALVAAASILALPALAGTPQLRRLRPAAMGVAVYLALLVPGVIANPSSRVLLEWTHRLVIVGGALLVGAWLVREHAQQAALRLLVGVSAFVALAAIVDSATSGFAPAFPFGLHKNFIGSLFAGVLVVLFTAAPAIHVAPVLRFSSIVVVALGLLASQSRGAELGAAVGLLLAGMLGAKSHSLRVRVIGAVAAVALAVVAFLSIQHQLNQSKADFNTSSAGVRVNVEHVTREIWRTSPFVGVGLKYYNTGDFGQFAVAPTNVIDNELAESGVFGLIGFVIVETSALLAGIRRRGSPLTAAAVGVVAGQLMHGMVDIYWSGGVVTLSFILLGIALAGASAAPGAGVLPRRVRIGIHRAR